LLADLPEARIGVVLFPELVAVQGHRVGGVDGKDSEICSMSGASTVVDEQLVVHGYRFGFVFEQQKTALS
jgi:hypothetical protein